MLFFPFAFGGRPVTLTEQRIAAWKKSVGDGLPEPPKVTAPAETRKQWHRVERWQKGKP